MYPKILTIFLNLLSVLSVLWLLWVTIQNPERTRLAARALVRRRGFTTIILVTLLVCVLSLLAMGGYFQNSFWGLSESTIRSQTGHFQVSKKGYTEHSRSDPWRWKWHHPESLQALIAQDSFLRERIQVVAPELSFTGLLSNGQNTRTFLGRAVDPLADRTLSAFGEQITHGDRLLPDDSTAALLGNGLAQSLNVKVGTGLTLLTATPHGSMAATDLETKGISQSFSRDYDDVALKIPLSTAWSMLGDTLCDKVLVLLYDTKDLEAVLSRTQQLAQAHHLDVEFQRWESLATYYQSVRTLYTGIFHFFSIVLLAFSAIFITSILEISTMQRRQEISLLRAFGVSPQGILNRFITESVLLGILGSLISLALSIGLIGLFNLHGLEAPPPPGSSRGYTILLRLWDDPWFVVQTGQFVFCTVVLSSIFPCWRGCKRPLIESLRHG